MTKYISGLVAALLFLTFISEAKSQDSIGKKFDRIENILSKLPKIYGIVNLRYQYSDASEGLNSFDIRRARVGVRGSVSASLDYRIYTEFAKTPKLLDAFITWKMKENLNLKAGQFKLPFSLENAYSSQGLEMVENSMVILGLCAYEDVSGISSIGRDMGINLFGGFLRQTNHNLFEYSIGLFNGNGINTSDNNRSKDFSGIISINPLKELTLSVSHYNGSTRVQSEAFQRVRTGGGIKYDNRKTLIRSEYIRGKTKNAESDGYYIVAGYFIHPKIQALVKYDYFQKDISIKETRQANYIVGINYFPVKDFHFKFNYSYRTTVNNNPFNHVALQFFAIF
ncbi:MAG: OprO/OprP family phosphate-selective porin [Prevotellaceae bacterium]|nr:OprO/OprP family phosphate-selective porin [Prevotellaceae bacterium]